MPHIVLTVIIIEFSQSPRSVPIIILLFLLRMLSEVS